VSITLLIFFAVAGMTLVGGLLAVVLKDVFRAALGLVLSLLGVAGLYLMLAAQFLAAAQVLVYIGGVAVLILFAIMLTKNVRSPHQRSWGSSLIPAALLFLLLTPALCIIAMQIAGPRPMGLDEQINYIDELAHLLMQDYMVPFEVVSLVLLAAFIGAIVIARRKPEYEDEADGGEAK